MVSTNRHRLALDRGRAGNDANGLQPFSGGTFTLDWSNHTGAEYAYQYSVGGQGTATESGYAHDYGTGDSINWSDYAAVSIRFGSGDDSFYSYGARTPLTLSGGGGTDTFVADWSDATAGIGFALGVNGASATAAGQGSVIAGFEVVQITTGSGNDSLTGGALDDELHGGAGTNMLNGGGGNDRLYTGAGAIDTIDGGAGSADRWYADLSTTAAGLTLSHTGTGSYALSNGTTVTGVERFEDVRLGTGNDAVTLGRDLVNAQVDGGGGTNSLILDHAADTGADFFTIYGAGYAPGSGSGSGSFDGSTDNVAADNFGRVTVRFGAADDQLYDFGGSTALTADGGDGTDRFHGDFSTWTGAISFALGANGAASTFTGLGSSISHFELVDIKTGKGDDSLTGGDGDDTLRGGSGTNALKGGGGNDTITSDPGSIDTVDGGAGTGDSWSALFAASTAALTISQTAGGYTLSNGGSITGVERFSDVELGSGDDMVTLGSDLTFADVNGGGGSNTLTINHAGDIGYDGFSAYAADYVGLTASAGGGFNKGQASISASAFERLSVNFGAGDDSFRLYGTSTRVTVNGGNGTDLFVADLSKATQAITFALGTSGAAATFVGQGSTISHFEQVQVTAGSGNDSLAGGDGADTLNGSGGRNTLKGGGGDDAINTFSGGIDTVDGGAGTNDHWSLDARGSAAALTISHGASGYALSNGGSVTGVERFDNIFLGNGNDKVTLGSDLVDATLDGGGGSNMLTLDHAADTGDGAVYSYSSAYSGSQHGTAYFGTTDQPDMGVSEANFGTINVVFGSANDGFYAYGSDQSFTADGGGGSDRFHGDFSKSTGAIGFALAANGAASSFTGLTGTLTRFESIDIKGGAGNDSLAGGAAADVLAGGTGVNTLKGGGGDDAITSAAGAVDTIDGGDGTGDRWTGDYSATAAALTIGHGAGGYTLSNGGNLTGIEQLTLSLGTGNDSVTLGADLTAAQIDGGGGSNSLTVDRAADTGDSSFSLYSADHAGHAYGSGTFDAAIASLYESNFANFTLSFGSGDDVYAGYGSQAATVNGGNGSDRFAGGGGDDRFDGGGGADTVVFQGDRIDYTISTTGGVTTVTDNRTGTGNQDGTDTLTGVETLQFADQSVTIGGNHAPAGVADSFSVAQNGMLTVSATDGVLSNDGDADGDPLTASLATSPGHGSVSLATDGSFTYTPAANFTGTDSFTYRDIDTSGARSDPVTVTISVGTVDRPPLAHADGFAATEDSLLTVGATAGVLANDSDPDGDPLTATLVSGPAHGTLALNSDGSFSYKGAADYNGTDSFTYRARDPSGLLSAPVAVTIAVGAVNDAPVAAADSYAGTEDTTLSVAAAGGVLRNDTDVDGDTLTAVLKAGPAHGTLTLNADGSFAYVPAGDYAGADSFTYQARDPSGVLSAVTTVSLALAAVNDAPVAFNDGYSVYEGAKFTITGANGVLKNDRDPDGDKLNAVLVSGPAHGTLTLKIDGSFAYTSASGFNGDDSFTYRAKDPSGLLSAPATVTLHVKAGQHNPVAHDDSGYATSSGGTLSVDAATGVLANDTDADGDRLSAILKTGPSYGTVTLNADGSFVYHAGAGASGVDSFTYQARDANGALSGAATVSILVNETQSVTITGTSGDDVITPAHGIAGQPLPTTGDDTLYGLAGNDYLDGGTGGDTMVGGTGNDTYVVDSNADTITERSGEGTDTVIASISYSLGGRQVENLTLAGSDAINGTGNSFANIITGNDGNNTLDGGTSADTMIGGKGDDTFLVDSSADTVVEKNGAGIDTVLAKVSYSLLGSYVENLTLQGIGTDIDATSNSIANTLNGSSGDNRIEGNGSADTLTGGGGADTFVYHYATDSNAAAFDTITDFHQSQHDRIDLTLFDADSTAAGRQGFHLIGTAAFSGHAGELRVETSGGTTFLLGDTNADSVADFKVALTGTIALTAADFAGLV